jgi:hypothetical protein
MSESVVTGPAGIVEEAGQDVPVDVNAILAKYQAQLVQPDASVMPSAETVPSGGTQSSAAEPSTVAQAAAKVAAPVETPVPEAKPEEPTLRAKQLAALARVEMEARQAKEQYEAKLRELEQKPKEPAAPRVESLEELRELFEIDPDAALASLNITDKSSIAARLMYGALGEDAPAELKQDMANRRRDAELAAIKRKLEKRDIDGKDVQNKAVFAARVEATDRELSSFVQSVPADMRFLAAEARTNPAELYQGLCTIAATHIQAGKFPSAREVAQALETQLEADYARLSRAVTGTTTTATPPATQSAPVKSPPSTLETLSDADTRGRPGLGDQPTREQLEDPEYWVERAKSKLRALGVT